VLNDSYMVRQTTYICPYIELLEALMGSWICTTEQWLQFTSGAFALLAALTWFSASRTKPSEKITEDQMGSRYSVPTPALVTLVAITTRQAKRNAMAALFAAIAAFCQIPQALMPTCWSGAPWFLSH
jgi:hypothetical protein